MATDFARGFFGEVEKNPPSLDEAIATLQRATENVGRDWRSGRYFLLVDQQDLLRAIPTVLAAAERGRSS